MIGIAITMQMAPSIPKKRKAQQATVSVRAPCAKVSANERRTGALKQYAASAPVTTGVPKNIVAP
jgi:hypothetical protein